MGFYSHYFLILKAKGGFRSILDLRELNKFLKKIKFQMVTLASIIPSLDTGDQYAALDLRHLFSHDNSSEPLKVPQVYGKLIPLSIHSATLRLISSSLDIHEMHSGSSIPVKVRSSYVPLPS